MVKFSYTSVQNFSHTLQAKITPITKDIKTKFPYLGAAAFSVRVRRCRRRLVATSTAARTAVYLQGRGGSVEGE